MLFVGFPVPLYRIQLIALRIVIFQSHSKLFFGIRPDYIGQNDLAESYKLFLPVLMLAVIPQHDGRFRRAYENKPKNCRLDQFAFASFSFHLSDSSMIADYIIKSRLLAGGARRLV